MIILYFLVHLSYLQAPKHAVQVSKGTIAGNFYAIVPNSIPHGKLCGVWPMSALDSPLSRIGIAQSLKLDALVQKRIPKLLASLNIHVPKTKQAPFQAQANQPSTTPAKGEIFNVSGYLTGDGGGGTSPEEIQFQQQRSKEMKKVEITAVALLNLGRVEDARLELESYQQTYGGDGETSCLLFDALMGQDQYKRAYKVIAASVKKYMYPYRDDTDIFLRLSLITALNGEIYKGQKEYAFYYNGGFKGSAEDQQLWPSKSDAVTIAAISANAIGGRANGGMLGENVTFYNDLAEELDPGEPLFVEGVLNKYSIQGQNQKGIDLIFEQLKTATGDFKILLTTMLNGFFDALHASQKLIP